MARLLAMTPSQAFLQGLSGPAVRLAPAFRGFGDDQAPATTVSVDAPIGAVAAGLAGFALLGVVVRSVASYYAGRAMAPSASDRTSYGVAGLLAGTFGGPIGLGLVGGYALSRK